MKIIFFENFWLKANLFGKLTGNWEKYANQIKRNPFTPKPPFIKNVLRVPIKLKGVKITILVNN